MRRSHLRFLLVGTLLLAVGAIGSAGDATEEAIKKDHQLIEGTWKVVSLTINGDKSNDEDLEKLKVINGSDGTWEVFSEGKEIAEGTSSLAPTKNPKSIDLKPTDGDDKGKTYLGIYELGNHTRKLCIAQAGKERPTKFSSEPGSEQILITFEREK